MTNAELRKNAESRMTNGPHFIKRPGGHFGFVIRHLFVNRPSSFVISPSQKAPALGRYLKLASESINPVTLGSIQARISPGATPKRIANTTKGTAQASSRKSMSL
jgi:hypothetical protein